MSHTHPRHSAPAAATSSGVGSLPAATRPLRRGVAALALLLATLLPLGALHAQQPAPAPAPTVETASFYLPPGIRPYIKRTDPRADRIPLRNPVLRGDDDDDDDSGREATDIQARFMDFGVIFPPGSQISYAAQVSKLVVTNTPEELEKIRRILGELIRTPSQINIRFVLFRVGVDTAAAWGLDGLPATKPETSPFAGPIPKFLSPDDAAKLFGALRKTEGFELISRSEVMTISGQTASTQGTDRQRMNESFSAPEVVTSGGDDDDDKTTTVSRPFPELGEEQRFGSQLTVTPTVGDDEYTVDLELRPTYTEVIGYRILARETPAKEATTSTTESFLRIPIIREYSVETRVLSFDGHSVLLGATQHLSTVDPALRADEEVRAPNDPRPVYFMITPELIKLKDTREKTY